MGLRTLGLRTPWFSDGSSEVVSVEAEASGAAEAPVVPSTSAAHLARRRPES